MKIKELEYNTFTLPKVIKDAFLKIDDFPKQMNFRKPFSICYNSEKDDINCYFLCFDWESFQAAIKTKMLKNIDGIIIDLKESQNYLLSYVKGFSKGYWEYLDSLKQSDLFILTNSDFSYKIFQRVWGTNALNLGGANKGTINALKHKTIETGNEICDFEDFNYIDDDLMFEQGIAAGQYYKAWELILSNPKQFESYFIEVTKKDHPAPENKKDKPQKEYRFNTIFPESVPDLFVELQNREMITSTKDHFIWAFGIGKDKPTDFKPIIWNGDNTLLAYLIDTACQNKNKWKVAEIIFGVTGLAQTFKNCNGNPRGKELIDEIKQEIG